MKCCPSIILAGIVFAGVVVGCGASRKVDTSKLEQSFQAAEASTKGDADKAASAIKRGDFDGAVTPLKTVIKSGALTDQQKDAISGVLINMQTIVAQHQKKYSVDLYNSISDLSTYLEGREPVTK